jgi:ribokinase
MAAKKMIAVVGSANFDMVVRLPRLPCPGETVLGGEFYTAAGGKGANQAVAAARAGGRVAFVGRVGADSFGREIRRNLNREKIDTSALWATPGTATGVALISVAPSGENAISVAAGANARLSPTDIDRARKIIEAAGFLLIQLEIPPETLLRAVETAAAAGAAVILNPAPASDLPGSVFGRLFMATPNETEAAALTGIDVADESSARTAGRALLERGCVNVIVTLGKRGALLVTRSGARLFPAFPARAVDTTAAGDVFNGALAAALAEGRKVEEAVVFANAAASISVTRPGAQPSCPYRAEVVRRLKAGP